MWFLSGGGNFFYKHKLENKMKEKEAKQIIESEFGDLKKEERSQYDTLVSLLVKYGADESRPLEKLVSQKTAEKTLLEYSESWVQKYNKCGREKDELKLFFITTAIDLFTLTDRILNAIKVGWWTYKNPDVFGVNVFKMLGDLLNLILKVSVEDRHYMTEIIVTNQRTGVKQPIVHIWAGAGIMAEPTKRIQELLEENAMLKERLRSN